MPIRRLQRLREELEDAGLPPSATDEAAAILLEEVDNALRPGVHERYVPSGGTILDPTSDPHTWAELTGLELTRNALEERSLAPWRRFVDGLSSWLLRRSDGRENEWMLFDRPAGSERDLVVLADALDATIVQRHPAGVVRIVGRFGVLRWEGLEWHHEPPIASWLDVVSAGRFVGDLRVVEALLRLAVHDLGSLGIGALLVYRPDSGPGPLVEERLAPPPPLRIRVPAHLAPLRHALAQVDGAALFDADGFPRQLGVRLVPSALAERTVPALRGTRHTSGLRYSHDDPSATVVVVSSDGPVAVLRDGRVLERPGGHDKAG